ncbi:MAG: hypothetical protein KBF66_02620 [Rhodoferax sp.]|uniref:hypothetical protein n=1 Tax=Rhodoferax sp. TaxID=50421 RepID=UPI001B75516C|nr:hypothetical protein [Rhodoferax sp.]MBP9904425.1 hypothetical protein [Rhodoferax sp.]
MKENWQTWLVLLIVVVAVLYSVWYVLPRHYRQRLGWLHRRLALPPACHACDQCGKCDDAALKKTPESTSGGEHPIHFWRKP